MKKFLIAVGILAIVATVAAIVATLLTKRNAHEINNSQYVCDKAYVLKSYFI